MSAAAHAAPARLEPLTHPLAESAVIAALVNLGEPMAIGRLILDHKITGDMFAAQAFRNALAIIGTLAADGAHVDTVTLAEHLGPADLAAVDSACREHVSAANFASHVALLKDYRRRREESAARDRLAKAAAAGVPDHELLAIVESIQQASAGAPNRCRLTAISELCNLPPTESWLIKRYLPADSLTALFGTPGCGKSFLSIDFACHVATGRDWRGQPVKQGHVVYVAGEGRNGLSKRFRAWFDRHGEQPRNISLLLTPVALTDPASVAALVADIRHLPEAAALVVVDTLNRNFGPGDENATADMTRAVAGLDEIRTATGAAVLTVHHSGHAEKSRGRGSSVLFGALDAEFAVELNENTVQIRSTKMKDADPPPPLAWTLEKQYLPWCDEEGAPMDSAVLVPADAPISSASKTALTRPQRSAKAVLEKMIERDGENVLIGDWRREAIAAGLTLSESRQGKHAAFTRAVDALVDAGIIEVDGNNCRLCAPSKRQQTGFVDNVDAEKPVIFANKTPSTRQQTSTFRQYVDAVDGGCSLSTRQHLSTHPFRGVDNVDVDASRQPAVAEPEQATAPTPPPPDPLATRVAELIASGWARSNAEARARSEALHREKTGEST